MEEKGLNGSAVTVKGDEAIQNYRVEPVVEISGQFSGSATAPLPSPPVNAVVPPAQKEVKKKRGRPRKYAADGSVVALSPMPISASFPFTGDFPAWKPGTVRPVDHFKKKHKLEIESPGTYLVFFY